MTAVLHGMALYLDVFTESRRVVVTGRLCIAEGFQNRVRGEDLLLDLTGLVDGDLCS